MAHHRAHDDPAPRFQFRVSSLLLLMAAVGLGCAAVAPRSFEDTQSPPGVVITTTQRGFPFTYSSHEVRTYADPGIPWEAGGTWNHLSLAGDVMITALPIAVLLLRSRSRRFRP